MLAFSHALDVRINKQNNDLKIVIVRQLRWVCALDPMLRSRADSETGCRSINKKAKKNSTLQTSFEKV